VFEEEIAKDTSFRPMGTKIHSFIRPAKAIDSKTNDSAAAINEFTTEYEVYHVSRSDLCSFVEQKIPIDAKT
jgi:hypothetical protein